MKSETLTRIRQRAKDGTLRNVIRDWKWILSFTRGRSLMVLAYTLCGIASSGIGLFSGVISKYLIDAMIARQTRLLLPLAGLMVLCMVVNLAMSSLTSRLSARLSIRMRCDVQGKVFGSLLHSGWMAIRRYPSGDLLNRFNADVGTVASCAVSWLPGLVIQLFTVLATLGVVLHYDPMMALIALASTPVLLLSSKRLLRRQRSFTQKVRQVSGDMSAFQNEVFRNVDTLKSFGVEDAMAEKLDSWQERYRETALEQNSFTIKTHIALSAMGSVVEYLALGYCLWRLWRGDILFGTMVLFLQQRSNLSSAFSALVSLVPTAMNGSVAAERIRELTELEKETTAPCPTVEGSCAVTMETVSAGYEGLPVVEQVSLEAPAGEITALVGPSGQGKSTLMRLMLGLIPPREGSVALTDSRGEQYPLGPDTRSLLTYVPQGNTVLAGTVAENLRLVNPGATRDELIAALEDACAWEFIRELPQGLDAPVGEGGKGFSEGQAQRIAIARALVRKAPVMLLDEVTSALDPETEQRVLKNLTNRGVTCIVSTHRPSVLHSCSRVYRVSQGRVEMLTEAQIAALQNACEL